MSKSIFHGMGYTLVDDRASDGKKVEADLMGCGHCQKLLKKADWQCDGGHCGCCMQPTCGPCADRILTHGCENFVRQLESNLNADYRRKQNAMVIGT